MLRRAIHLYYYDIFVVLSCNYCWAIIISEFTLVALSYITVGLIAKLLRHFRTSFEIPLLQMYYSFMFLLLLYNNI